MASANAVIVSADLEAQQGLASLLDTCGLAPIITSTVKEAEAVLNMESTFIVLCSDELPDGSFRDILRHTAMALDRVPVVVFSRLADWERYLIVLRSSAFDYVLYPPSRGEIERVVLNALSCGRLEKAKRAASAS
jgi:DNA-binding NtrC family response regulator